MGEATGNIVAIVANPYSGSARNRELVDALAGELRGRGIEPVMIWEKAALAAHAADRAFVDRCRCVVAAGGDGTVLHVLNSETALPLVHFPLGTENLFAREFNVPRDPAIVAAMIERGTERTIDLGVAGGKRFACVASAGFDAEVVRRLAAWRGDGAAALRRVRRSSYPRHMAAATLLYRFSSIVVRTEEGREFRGSQVFVQNLPQYGLGFRVCPDARGDDGLLDFVVCDAPSRWRMIRLAMAARRARHLRLPWVQAGRARRLTLEAAEPGRTIPLQIDGDPAGELSVTIECLPAAQRVIVPVG